MKNAIIERSIEELQRNGLRFSLDEVSRSLKISKKTIYKYFPAKECLAIEIYKTFYGDVMQKAGAISEENPKDAFEKMLWIYYRSYCMARDEIFNKYALNANVRALALDNHSRIRAYAEGLLPQADRAALLIIIDGALQKLSENKDEEEKVIARLAKLIL